jgi:hypothetical protein
VVSRFAGGLDEVRPRHLPKAFQQPRQTLLSFLFSKLSRSSDAALT